MSIVQFFFDNPKSRFVNRSRTIFILILMVASAGCSKSGKTFTPPVPDSTNDGVLTAIHAAGGEFKAYAIASTRSQKKVQAISVSVKNDLKTFAQAFIQNGALGVGFEPLKPDEVQQVTKIVLNSVTDYLQDNFEVSESAPYEMAILIYGSNSVNFDSNQNPSGELDAYVVFLDVKSKLILWHADVSGTAKDVISAAKYASASINQHLNALFGQTK
jgi:hypothetical protein